MGLKISSFHSIPSGKLCDKYPGNWGTLAIASIAFFFFVGGGGDLPHSKIL